MNKQTLNLSFDVLFFFKFFSIIVLYSHFISGMLPLFSNLKYWYPGNVDYGGSYSDQDVFQAVNISSTGVEDNTTCVLRMSTALTLNPGHQVREPYEGSVEGTANNYYFYDQREFLSYLEKMYGFPISSTTTDTFRGIPGIMFINVTGTIRSDDVCSILLWDGTGFHQGKGYLHHYAIEKVFLWPAPSGMKTFIKGILHSANKYRLDCLKCINKSNSHG